MKLGIEIPVFAAVTNVVACHRRQHISETFSILEKICSSLHSPQLVIIYPFRDSTERDRENERKGADSGLLRRIFLTDSGDIEPTETRTSSPSSQPAQNLNRERGEDLLVLSGSLGEVVSTNATPLEEEICFSLS
jgi:hypothetical protein